MRFQGFYGNERAKRLLSGAVDAGCLPHAILIDGPEGSGKKTLASLIAQAAVCEGDGEKPCGKCRQCVNAREGNHPDIALYAAGSSARSFPVDTVRKIRMDASVAPNDAAKKVYILAGVQNMTEQAQNALLKILEEPPAYVLFVLTCESRAGVLATVQSRCALIPLGPVTGDEAAEALEKTGMDPETAKKAALLSGGLIGRAIAGVGDGSFAAAAAVSGDFVRALCASREYDLLRLTGRLEKEPELLHAFLGLLPLLFRDAAAVKAGLPSYLSGRGEEAERLAAGLTARAVFSLTQISLEAGLDEGRYVNKTLLLTSLFARLWRGAHDPETY